MTTTNPIDMAVLPGETEVTNVIYRALILSDAKRRPVRFLFNDVRLTAHAGTTARELVEKYNRARRHAVGMEREA